jgi:transposase/transposase-like protein
MPSPKLVPLLLTEAERSALEALVRKRTASQSLALRARIVLACADDGGVAPLTAVAERAGVSRESVRKWRVRFMQGRMKGLTDAPRPGAPRKITAPCLPVLPTTPARMTHDYVRHGTTSLFAAYDLASGSVIAQSYRRHRHQEFLRFLKLIDGAVPKELDLHLVLDNYATHKTPAIHQWLLKHPRFCLHFTPTSSSWLNLVERWFAELTNRKLRRSAHRSVTELEDDIRKWINEWNKDPRPFVWTKSADDILETVAEYCQRITDSGH